MTVLIVFESVEGHTRKIARFAEAEVRKSRQEALLHNTADPLDPVSFDGVDKVILAAPVHERRHPKAFEAFITDNLDALDARDTLMISVSLSAAFPEGMEDAIDYLLEMKMRTKFTPDAEALVAGAVRTGKYDYFAAMVVRHVVLRDRDYDLDKGSHDFTDWDAVAAKIAEFLATGYGSGPAARDAGGMAV